MSQITTIGRFGFVLLLGLVIFGGCGTATPNDKANFDPDTGGHASDWMVAQHVSASNEDSNSCKECHGSDFSGGLSSVACAECHLNGSPLTATGCASCHAKPPLGATAPNRIGAHWPHNGLPSNVNMCDSCHSGAGTKTVNHYNGKVEVKFLSVYSSKSGTAIRNADGSCSLVSCHGGQKTPAWYSGSTIDVNTQCTACHAFGTAENNSFNSGRHNTHVNVYRFACTKCHDTTLLQTEHFTTLNTSAVEGDAAKTIDSSLSYTSGVCLLACHNARPW
jgi:predicted CxxxxCH...CXXCH cytochrome family protein